MFDVPNVSLEARWPTYLISTIHLAPPGEAGSDEQPFLILRRVVLQLVRQSWSRANHAHLPGDYVRELREFVEAEAPQPLSDTRNSRITASDVQAAPGVLGSGLHGAELSHSERCCS